MLDGFPKEIDFTALWTWFLFFTRLVGVFIGLPGLGTDLIPRSFRGAVVLALSVVFALTGARAEIPGTLAPAGLVIITEFLLGYVLGIIPLFIISGLTVAGQVVTGAMGLGQANMIDPSLGGSFSILSQIQGYLGTVIFLSIDGHHTVLRAASFMMSDVGNNPFLPDASTALILLDRFRSAFELAVTVSGPLLVTLLVTQFILGLITKFVPQVNIFIISLPLTVFLGMFMVAFGLSGVGEQLVTEFSLLEDISNFLVNRTP